MRSNSKLLSVSCYGAGGASTRVRLYDWFRHVGLDPERHEYIGTSDNQPARLARAGMDVARAEVGLRALARRVGGRTLILSRQASPFSVGSIEEMLLRRADYSIYDFDDALFADTSFWASRIWSSRRVWTRSIQAADIVIAGSDLLAEEASKFTKNVIMVPSCIEPLDYVMKSDYDLSEAPRAVWIGSPPTEPFLCALAEPLLALHDSFGLRLSVISAGSASLGTVDRMVDRHSWSPTTFSEKLAEADFGVMPLPDTPYARGKCSYKLLQYAACGLPIIGTPVGANARVLDVLGGYSASTPAEWYAAAAAILVSSASQRAKWGLTARESVIRHYSYAAWEETWLCATRLGPPMAPSRAEWDV